MPAPEDRAEGDEVNEVMTSLDEPRPQLTVAEITTAGKGYPTEVAVGQKANLSKESFVTLDNVQTVSKARFVKCVGTFDDATMRIVGRRLILALGLEDA